MVILKKFYFARHGTTDWNQKNLCQGQLDIELNEVGRQEANFLGEAIKAFPFSRICVSPLKRAFETAIIVQKQCGDCKIHIIEDLKERSWGKLEGISSAEMYRIEEMEEENTPLPIENNVEDRKAFQKRVLNGLNLALSGKGIPLIISHGRVFLSLCEVLQIPLIRQIPNSTLIECVPSKEGWVINLING